MNKKNKQKPTNAFFDFDCYVLPERYDMETLVKNPKSILILTPQAAKEDTLLLQKIMQAVGKKMEEDVFFVNDSTLPTFKQLYPIKELQFLIVFGLRPEQIGLHVNTKPYQPIVFQGVKILFSHALSEIATDVNKKKALWVALQQLFPKS